MGISRPRSILDLLASGRQVPPAGRRSSLALIITMDDGTRSPAGPEPAVGICHRNVTGPPFFGDASPVVGRP